MTASRRGLELDAATSARLSRQRQRDTGAERLVRSLLHRLGHRFRVGGSGLPGRPDVSNVARGWAVFVHGCYWHAHPGCSRATVPKRNRAFWVAKFEANRARDRRDLRLLRAMGFRAMVVWECEIEERPEAVARRLDKALG